MPRWPVSHQDGIYQVTDRDGLLYPIIIGGQPASRMDPGWYPVGLQTGLPPFQLLELRNDESGRDGIWYLNEELVVLTHTAANFTEAQAGEVTASLSPLLRDIYDQSICAPEPATAASSDVFAGINPYGLRELIGVVVQTALSPPDIVAAERLQSVSAHYSAAGLQLSSSLLRHSLDLSLPETPHAGLMLASPFDASLLAVQEAVAPDDGVLRQAYRFYDAGAGVALYLLAGEALRALYIPAMNTIFTDHTGVSGAQVMTALLTAYASGAVRPLPAAAAPEPRSEPGNWPALPTDDAVAGTPTPAPANWWKRMFGLGHA